MHLALAVHGDIAASATCGFEASAYVLRSCGRHVCCATHKLLIAVHTFGSIPNLGFDSNLSAHPQQW